MAEACALCALLHHLWAGAAQAISLVFLLPELPSFLFSSLCLVRFVSLFSLAGKTCMFLIMNYRCAL